MVELKPREYHAVCDRLGAEWVDLLAGNSRDTDEFWALVEREVGAAEAERIRASQTTVTPLG